MDLRFVSENETEYASALDRPSNASNLAPLPTAPIKPSPAAKS